MTYADTVRFLFSLGPELKTVKWDLERIRLLLGELGDPQERCRYIHVAGTNGKGSTCAILANTLHHAQLRTGLYTSPHLIEATERIQIDGQSATQDDFVQAFETVHRAVEALMKKRGQSDAAALVERTHEGADALIDAEQRILLRIRKNRYDDAVKQPCAPLDDIEMPIRQWIE